LGQLGLAIKKKGRKLVFSQPCDCFDGKWCSAYSSRPGRCRAFECRLLLRVRQGVLKVPSALKTIADARRKAESVRSLLRALGNTDEGLAMTRRYSKIMAQPLDLADDNAVEIRARLMVEVAELMTLFQRDFLT